MITITPTSISIAPEAVPHVNIDDVAWFYVALARAEAAEQRSLLAACDGDQYEAEECRQQAIWQRQHSADIAVKIERDLALATHMIAMANAVRLYPDALED